MTFPLCEENRTEENTAMRNTKLQRLIIIAMLSGVATLLMKLNFPLPFLPPFLKIDFAEIPAVLALLTLGPVAAIGVEFFKNVFYLMLSGSITGVPVGEIANFTTGVLFLIPIYLVYRKVSTSKGLTAGLIAGTVTMAFGMTVLNYLVFLPMYTKFLGMEAFVGQDLYMYLVAGVLPFNLIKGIALTLVMMLVFNKMKPWIMKQQRQLQVK